MKNKIDLNAPAFGTGAQKVEPAAAGDNPVVKEEDSLVAKPITTPVVEPEGETSVPYKRFKKFHDAAKEAQDEAAYWRAKALEAEEVPRHQHTGIDTDNMPSEWVQLYGNEDASKKAWAYQQRLLADMENKIRNEALQTVRNQQYQEQERTDQNVERLDSEFEDLGDLIGRPITANEENALLDIIDDYTPKDRYGNYASDILPVDKAWEIYELKTQASKAPRNASRDSVAALTGSQTQGDTSVSTEQDKNWNPLDWNAWRKRI